MSVARDSLEMVFRSPDPIAVQMARDLLAESGIECFIFDGEAARMLGGAIAIAPRLMAPASLAAQARRRLAELGFTRQ